MPSSHFVIKGQSTLESFVSYDDAVDRYDALVDQNGDEWAEYHSIEEVQGQPPAGVSGRVWKDDHGVYSCRGNAADYDNAVLVELK